jgi:hypothetical protein
MVIQSATTFEPALEWHVATLCAQLIKDGHEAERLDLPRVADLSHSLSTAASHRLMSIQTLADAIICLDPLAAVVRHPHKIIWLLDEGDLASLPARATHAEVAAKAYFDNVLLAGLHEAMRHLAPSTFAQQRLTSLGFPAVGLLAIDGAGKAGGGDRRPGREILLLSPIDGTHRPELFVALMAALPATFRARWIAPFADPAVLGELQQALELHKIDHRVTIDLRSVDDDERHYLLEIAAALIHLPSGVFTTPRLVTEAVERGVPVISCADGGAVAAVGQRPEALHLGLPVGSELATLVERACREGVKPSEPSPKERPVDWSTLRKALRP